MRWPDWLSSKSSSSHDEGPDSPSSRKSAGWLDPLTSITATASPASPKASKPPVSWTDSLNATHWTSAEILVPTVVLTATTLAAFKIYTVYLRRIPQATFITPPALQGNRSIFGYVTSVGDGDTFRLYHTPGGRLLGWGWLWGRRVAEFDRGKLKEQTIQVRIAGIDAPELAHFGKPEQAYGKEALAGLRSLVLGRFVRAKLWRQDQYQRVVGTVTVKRWGLFNRDVGLAMLKGGHATVYEAKFGSEFGGMEEKYRAAEKRAKSQGVGMWKGQAKVGWLPALLPEWLQPLVSGKKKEKEFETPRQFKDRTNALEKEKKESKKT